MATNVGTFDRTLRIVAGLALIAAALGVYGPNYMTIWGWIGAIPLVSGFLGWCPAYTVFGIKTCEN